MNQLKKNYLYNVFYEILAVCVPLITTPYASRILGADGIGIYSYTYSIAYYFMLTAVLGINNYGSREIAKKRNDKNELSYTFLSIYIIQIVMSTIVILVYFIYVLNFTDEYKIFFLIQSLYIFSSMVDINWFYYGIENFKLTVTRNSVIKILSLVLIFALVRTKDDIWIYTFILSGSTLLSNYIIIAFLKKYINLKKIKKADIIKHIKPCFVLFIPVIAMKIYKVIDKTMLGFFSDIEEVGYYSNAEGIINVPMGIIIALGTVMLPRLSNMISNGNKDEADKLFLKTLKFALFISVPIMFGLISIGKDFSIVFLGSQFEKSGTIVQLLAITVILMTIANVIRTQYLIPNNKDKQYIIAVVMGAIVNLLSNSILIKPYGAIGASIGTILAELTVMILHVMFANKYIEIAKSIIRDSVIIIKGLCMFIIVYLLGKMNLNIYIRLIIQVTTGIIIYTILNYSYIMENINIKKLINRREEE